MKTEYLPLSQVPEWEELSLPLPEDKLYEVLPMGLVVSVKSEISHGYEMDMFGTTRRKLYKRMLPNPRAGYYVGWTFRRTGIIVPPNREDPGGLKVNHSVRVARIKFTERSNDRFTIFQDLEKV